MPEEISFPRQYARTQRFTLGVPHNFSVAPDGSRVAFLRSRSGTDGNTCLWVREVASGAEHVVADPGAHPGRRRRGTAAGRAGPARARQAAGLGNRRLRHRRRAAHRRLRPVRAAVRRQPHRRRRQGAARRRAGDRPAPGPVRGRRRLRERGSAARHRGRRQRGPRAGRARRPGRDLRAGRVRRRRGDGPHPRLLVVSRRGEPARGPGGHQPGDPLVHSPTRRTRTGPRPRSGTRSRAPRTPTSP